MQINIRSSRLYYKLVAVPSPQNSCVAYFLFFFLFFCLLTFYMTKVYQFRWNSNISQLEVALVLQKETQRINQRNRN